MTTPPQHDVEQEVGEARAATLEIACRYCPDRKAPHTYACLVRQDVIARFESAVRAAALREAHVRRCNCHSEEPGGCYWGMLPERPSHSHPYTDPRCERMRAGK